MINISNVLTSFMSISNSELKTALTTFTQRSTNFQKKEKSGSALQYTTCILWRHQTVNSQQPSNLYHPDSGEYNQNSHICYCATYFNIILRDAQIPCTMSSWRINFIRWRLTFVDSQYET